MKTKGQGALEYILLLAGVLLVVAIVVVILKSIVLAPAYQNVNSSNAVLSDLENVNIALPSNSLFYISFPGGPLSLTSGQAVLFVNNNDTAQNLTVLNPDGSTYYTSTLQPGQNVTLTFTNSGNYQASFTGSSGVQTITVSGGSTPPSSNCAPPATGNWVVSGSVVCSSTTIILNGSLIVNSGNSISLNSVTLQINDSSGVGININGGSANIQSSVINNYTSTTFNFTVASGSNFTLQGSTISGLNTGVAFLVESNNAQIISNTIQGDYALTVFNATNDIIQGNTLQGNTRGLYLVNSSYDTISGNNIQSNSGSLFVNFNGASLIGTSAGNVYSQNTFNNLPSGTDLIIGATNGDSVKYNTFENSQNGLEVGINQNMLITENQFTNLEQVGITLIYEDSANTVTSNTFSNVGQGISIQDSYGDITVQSNTFTNSSAVYVTNSTSDNVISNTFNLYPGQTGVLYSSNTANLLVNSNTVNNGDYGFNGPVGGGSNFSNITISNNVFSGQAVDAIHLYNIENSTITGNTIYNSAGYGIDVFGSNNSNISGNTIQNSTTLDVQVTYNSGCSSPSNNTLIQSNNFSFGVFRSTTDSAVNDVGVCSDCNNSGSGTITSILQNLPNNNSITVSQETCPTPPSSGCPYVETSTNGDWTYQGGTILGLVTPYLAAWRTEKLYNTGASTNLSVMIHEIPSETGYYNGFKLLVVDHPTGQAFFNQDEDSTPLIVNNPLNVLNCTDSYDRNCLPQIQNNEFSFLQGKSAIQGFTILNQQNAAQNAWFSPINFSNPLQLNDWIQLTLPSGWKNASEIKLLVTGTATGLNSLAEDYWGENGFNHNIVGFLIQNTPLADIVKKGIYYFSSFSVEAQQADGSWKVVVGNNNCVLDDYKTCAISIPVEEVQTGRVRIVEPAFVNVIDSVKVDYTPSFAFVSSILPSSINAEGISYAESNSGLLTSELTVPENNFVIVNFTGLPPVKPGFKRTYFLDFNGWYDPQPIQDLSLIQKTINSLKLADAISQVAFLGSPIIEEQIFLKAYPESVICNVFASKFCVKSD